MKAIQTVMLDAHMHRVEAELAIQIRTLFGRCPELAGFAVQDMTAIRDLVGLCHAIDRPDEKPRLYVTDIGFSATVSLEELEAVYTLIGTAIYDVVSERPEAFDLLCGRTFARTLH